MLERKIRNLQEVVNKSKDKRLNKISQELQSKQEEFKRVQYLSRAETVQAEIRVFQNRKHPAYTQVPLSRPKAPQKLRLLVFTLSQTASKNTLNLQSVWRANRQLCQI